MERHAVWEFTDDRGHVAAAGDVPLRVVAYIQAGATLWDHGIRPVGIFGSFHDGDAADPAKAGTLPLGEVRYLGAGAGLGLEAVLAAEPDLVVAVTYGGGQVYGVDPDVAKHLEEHVPVVVVDVGQGRSLTAVRERFAGLARSLGRGTGPGPNWSAPCGSWSRPRRTIRGGYWPCHRAAPTVSIWPAPPSGPT